jgi:hypothetical protein
MGWSDWQDGYTIEVSVGLELHMSNNLGIVEVDGLVDPATLLAIIEAKVADISAGTGTWEDSSLAKAGFGLLVASSPTGAAEVQAQHSYEAATVRGSSRESELPNQLPPGVFVGSYDPMPPAVVDDRCLEGTVQFETVSMTFEEWLDGSVYSFDLLTDSNDGAGNGPDPGPAVFIPPTSVSFAIRVCDPLTPGVYERDDDNDGQPVYVGPHITAADTDPLATFDMDPRSTDRTSAPYTEDGTSSSEQTDGPTDFGATVVPLSTQSRKDLSLVVMSRYFIDQAIPLANSFGTADRGMLFSAFVHRDGDANFNMLTQGTLLLSAHYTTPRWRYWIGAWHTAGGHFGTPADVDLYINTPGIGMVRVLDGPG